MAGQEKKAERPLFGEIAFTTGGRDITRGFVDQMVLQPTDSVLRARGGGNYKLYEEVRRDDQVKATFSQRRGAVTSREWYVEAGGDAPADQAAAEFLEENLKALQWDQICDKMLFGVFYGYAVSECIWELRDNRIWLADIKVRKRQRFRWDTEGNLRLLTVQQPSGEIMPERKFWTFATGEDNDDEPYGLGLAHWLYWPVFFKRNGVRFWLIFLEKFGSPTGLGKFPPGANDDDKAKLLAAVQAIQTEGGIIIPEGMMIELLEAKRSGTSDHSTFYDKMDAAISKVVLSQTMTTDDGSSLSQSKVHKEVRDEVVKSDADVLSASFNCGPVAWLTAWNFPNAKPPRVWRRVEDDPDLKPVAERDKLIHDMGFQASEDYVRETYGEGWTKRKVSPPSAPGTEGGEEDEGEAEDGKEDPAFAERCPGCGAPRRPAAFAEGDIESLQDPADELTDPAEAESAKALDDLIDRFGEIVAGAESLEELAAGLFEAYPEISTEELGESIGRSLVLAGAVGHSDIIDRE